MGKFYQLAVMVSVALMPFSAPVQDDFKEPFHVLEGFQQDSQVQGEYVQYGKEIDSDTVFPSKYFGTWGFRKMDYNEIIAAKAKNLKSATLPIMPLPVIPTIHLTITPNRQPLI